MGLFDKLFGGKRPEPDASTSSAANGQPSSTSPATPMPEGPVPARRERSKPGDVAATTDVDDAGEQLAPLPMDGENATLLAAIAAVVAGDGAQTRQAMYAAILESQLLLVSMGGEDLGTGEITLQEGQQLMLATMKGPDGQVFLPAFTDVERLARTLPEKARYLRMPAPAVCRMFLQGGGEGILLNAGQPPSGIITRAEAEILAAGVAPQIGEDGKLRVPPQQDVQQQLQIAIGKPEKEPAASFTAAIAAKAAELPGVREAHVFQAKIGEQPSRLMIGLLMDAGITPEEMHLSFEAIGKAAFEAKGEADTFDMMPLNDEMIEAIRPVEGIVYSRSQQV